MNLIFASLIILVPLITLVFMNMPAIYGMSISAFLVLLTSIFVWKMDTLTLSATAIQGAHKTLSVLWILFGALFLLNVLNSSGAVIRITQGFNSLTKDMRLQIIIITWLFGGLIEGVAGFGTPAIVTAPLLIALGFPAVAAVSLALIGDSTSAIFGAVNTPVNVGLNNLAMSANQIHGVETSAAMLDVFSGTFMPLILVFFTTFVFTKKKSLKSVIEMVPWALLIGLSYTLSEVLFAYTLGGDFISILSPILTLAIAVISIKFHILTPKKEWREIYQVDEKYAKSMEVTNDMPLWQAWTPYGLVVLLLFLTRAVPPIKAAFNSLNFGFTDILSQKGITSDWQILYSPGTILVIAGLLGLIVQKQNQSVMRNSFRIAGKEIMSTTGITLMVTFIMVQIFSNSGINHSGLESMPIVIADNLVKWLGGVWVFVAPFLGGIGAFITGSSTVSSLTFAPIQASVAAQTSASASMILGQQLIGGAVGNMISIHNIVEVSSVVGMKGKEGVVLKNVMIPAVIYFILAGIGGLVLSYFL